MVQRREITKLQIVITLHVVTLTHRREHLGLLHRVHTQISLQIQIRLQQINRIPRHLSNHLRHHREHLVGGASGC